MENRRILITKQLLCESFISLLKQKPIDKISVTELCQAANVNKGLSMPTMPMFTTFWGK